MADVARLRTMWALLILPLAFGTGAIPFSNVFARLRRQVDLREHGPGTVSGTSLYQVAGFGTLAVAGILDIAKGALWPAVAVVTDQHAAVGPLAAGLAVAGHNWSPFLSGAGGRGISPAIGGLLAVAWPGAVVLLGGMAVGRLLKQTGLGSLVAQVSLAPVLAVTHGGPGALAGAAVTAPMLAKRLLGNRPATGERRQVLVSRLLFDRDG